MLLLQIKSVRILVWDFRGCLNDSLINLSCFSNFKNAEIAQKQIGNHSAGIFSLLQLPLLITVRVCVPVFDTDLRTQSAHPGEHMEHREVSSGGMLLPSSSER